MTLRNRSTFICLLTSVCLILLNGNSFASTILGEGAFFSRCYSHFTGETAGPFHPLLMDSIQKNDHSNTIKNCMKVFDKARLIPNKISPLSPGYPSGHAMVNELDPEALKVMNYFFGVFQTYFEEKTFAHRPQTYSGVVSENWDGSEDALYLVRAAFEGQAVDSTGAYISQFNIGEVLTSTESLTGKRLFPRKNNHAVGVCNSYGSNCSYSPTAIHRNLQPQSWLQLGNWNWGNSMGSTGGTGPLTGIKVWPEGQSTYYGANGAPYSFSDMPRSHGGGAIGSTSYILKNAQYSGSVDGGVFNRRRIVKNAFSSFLCRDQPPLPMDDPIVLQRVNDYFNKDFNKSQTIAFRESVLCASCHVAYDEAASVFRNTYVTRGGNNYDWNSDGYTPGNYGADADKERFGYDRMTKVGSHTVDPSIIVPDSNLVNGSVSNPNALQRANNVLKEVIYSRSTPKGRLVFTDYRGQAVDVTLPASDGKVAPADAGIQELGEAMVETDQYYACMTKRMLFHFTGVDISLENPFDTRVQDRSPEEEFYLSGVIEPLALGSQGLQGHQSFRRLIQEIISLDLYREANLRGVAP
jgi:hypothetical protein